MNTKPFPKSLLLLALLLSAYTNADDIIQRSLRRGGGDSRRVSSGEKTPQGHHHHHQSRDLSENSDGAGSISLIIFNYNADHGDSCTITYEDKVCVSSSIDIMYQTIFTCQGAWNVSECGEWDVFYEGLNFGTYESADDRLECDPALGNNGFLGYHGDGPSIGEAVFGCM